MKQQFYGHFLATRIFHLATEKKFQSPLGARIKKLISDPVIANIQFIKLVNLSGDFTALCKPRVFKCGFKRGMLAIFHPS